MRLLFPCNHWTEAFNFPLFVGSNSDDSGSTDAIKTSSFGSHRERVVSKLAGRPLFHFRSRDKLRSDKVAEGVVRVAAVLPSIINLD